jgi:hypothetical protein
MTPVSGWMSKKVLNGDPAGSNPYRIFLGWA